MGRMAIPDEVKEKLDSDSAWAVQHEDIVQVMDETQKTKPWSRYMIQQHLEGEPAKRTVQDRLDELVELDILDKYEYSNQTLYDLAYDPIVTDGGRLKDASLVELATLRDRTGARDLASGAILTSFVFFGISILTEVTELATEFTLSGNFYSDVAFSIYIFGFVLLLVVGIVQKLEPWLPSKGSS